MKRPVVLAITGASGAPYAQRLLEILLESGEEIHLTMSPSAVVVFEREVDRKINLSDFKIQDLLRNPNAKINGQIHYHHYRDFQAGIASGSFLTLGMVICPCSMGTVAAIANGVSQNLIHRAADVHLKERRKLILVPRETPLGLIHLKNMLTCTEAGAIVLPAMPGFYTRPQNLEDIIDFVVGRICDQLEIDHSLLKRWGTDREEPS